MLNFQSLIVYTGALSISFLFAHISEKRNNKYLVWIIVLMLSLIAGLRSVSVGIDTKTYDLVFSLITEGYLRPMYGIEKNYVLLCSFFLKLWNNHQFLLFVFAFITHGLILFRLWYERNHISFSFGVISYYILFFGFSLNGMRQMFAASIVFYSTIFVKKGKYFHFLIAVLIAAQFHSSALIGIAYLLFEIIFIKYFSAKRKLIIWLNFFLVILIGLFVTIELLDIYSKYFEVRDSSIGLMMVIKCGLLFTSIYIVKLPKNKDLNYLLYSYRWYYFVGLTLNSLNYFFMYLGRIGVYFYLFEAIYIGIIFKMKNRNYLVLFFKGIYLMLLIYYFVESLTRGPQGEIPYLFFWQV